MPTNLVPNRRKKAQSASFH